MYARLSTYEAGSGDIDQLVEACGGDDRLTQMPGILDAFLLVNRSSGKAVTVTLWDSEETLAASAAAATRIRQEASGAAGGTIQVVEVYEVALHLAEGRA